MYTNVLLLGADGYIGYPLYRYLKQRGYTLSCVDNLWRRFQAEVYDGGSVTPVDPAATRFGRDMVFMDISKDKYVENLARLIKKTKPDTIINLAQQPSAPLSMLSRKTCVRTEENNVGGLMNVTWAVHEINPDIHIITLGSMGEYGQPDGHIRETASMPKNPNSFYHVSKVNASAFVRMSAKTWDMRVTDIMQGVVYGCFPWDKYMTRYDAGPYFGTFINQKTAQAVKYNKIDIHGTGEQTRAFISIQDSIRAIELLLEHPPDGGRLRVVHQFGYIYTLNEVGDMISEQMKQTDLTEIEIRHQLNPRNERETPGLDVEAKILKSYGFMPEVTIQEEIKRTIRVLGKYSKNIPQKLNPEVGWD